ncbi:MAG: gamma-glutamylcyclotransferase family protein, partial [Actinomycetota bacterium]|nr:gamma-glutamylcyclotransferase family protein [Actinomycetota bacterium]
VEGLVYRLDLSDLPKLDSVEGKGYGYDRHLMTFQVVVDGRTKMLEAWAYLADADFIRRSPRLVRDARQSVPRRLALHL